MSKSTSNIDKILQQLLTAVKEISDK